MRVHGPAGGSDLTSYLHTLQQLGLAEYQKPVVGEAVRRGIWTIADPYLRFWFRFVLPFRNRLEHGVAVERFYTDVVRPALDQFVSKPTFEEICRAWLLDQVDASVWAGVDRVGAWWGPIRSPTPDQPRRQTQAEIEVVAAAGNRVIAAGEAKWTRGPVGIPVLNHLREVVRYVPGADERTELILFGREFEPRLRQRAAEEGVRVVSASELFGEAISL